MFFERNIFDIYILLFGEFFSIKVMKLKKLINFFIKGVIVLIHVFYYLLDFKKRES